MSTPTLPAESPIAVAVAVASHDYSDWGADELDRLVMSYGLCVGSKPPPGQDPWYDEPDADDLARGDRDRRAREACRGCPVTSACLERALRLEAIARECHGIAGGVSARRRRQILRQAGLIRPSTQTPAARPRTREDAAA